MKDITLSTHLKGLTPVKPTQAAQPGNGFADTLQKTLKQVNSLQNASDKAVTDLHSGQGGSLHETMLSLEKADISMRLVVQMRNKVVEAYQEVMRMQV